MTQRLTWRVAAGVLVLAWVVTGQLVGPTSASLNARVRNENNELSTAALVAPEGLTAAAVGRTVQLAWNAGENGNSYAVRRGAAVAGSCTGANVSQVATPSPTSYTDSFYQPQGTTFCYEVATRHSAWTSVNDNPRVAVRVGFFVESVTAASGGAPGALSTGDILTFTFNQPVNPTTGPSGTNTVCTTSATGTGARLVVGSTATSGACSGTDLGRLGRFTGISSTANARFAATYGWSPDGRSLTVTVGNRTVGNANPTIGGVATFNPVTTASLVLSASGSHHVCDTNTGGGDCLRAATGTI